MAQFCVAARPGGLPGARIHRWLARARHKSPLAPAGPNVFLCVACMVRITATNASAFCAVAPVLKP
ncbi:hypothetical protein BN130_875 [Cronobacter malonaticus 507]|nr:hypothetical protein BN130_875 [Cronobacter malonaticus 507]